MTTTDGVSVYNKNVSFDELNRRFKFKCDFCPNTFCSEEKLNVHVLEHFEKKDCSHCDKLLLRIGSKWYSLHIDEIQLNKPPETDLDDSVTEIKLEICEEEEEEEEEDVCRMNKSDVEIDSWKESVSFVVSSIESNIESKLEIKEKITRNPRAKRKNDDNGTTEKNQKPSVNVPRRKGRLPRITCRICDRLILKYNFVNHLQKMHVPSVIVKEKNLKCDTCGKSFGSKGNLKTHQSVHSESRRFVCSYCGTSFRQLYHLTEHMNAHTGQKPYHCKICDKRYGRLHILRAHQRIHTGEKPYRCKIDNCDRAYAYDIDLKRHKFSAHGIYTKKYICTFCEKVFPENKLLKKHLESHSAGNIRRIASEVQ